LHTLAGERLWTLLFRAVLHAGTRQQPLAMRDAMGNTAGNDSLKTAGPSQSSRCLANMSCPSTVRGAVTRTGQPDNIAMKNPHGVRQSRNTGRRCHHHTDCRWCRVMQMLRRQSAVHELFSCRLPAASLKTRAGASYDGDDRDHELDSPDDR
jgi:hypothetical protein